jgi:hypothetical protein
MSLSRLLNNLILKSETVKTKLIKKTQRKKPC